MPPMEQLSMNNDTRFIRIMKKGEFDTCMHVNKLFGGKLKIRPNFIIKWIFVHSVPHNGILKCLFNVFIIF